MAVGSGNLAVASEFGQFGKMSNTIKIKSILSNLNTVQYYIAGTTHSMQKITEQEKQQQQSVTKNEPQTKSGMWNDFGLGKFFAIHLIISTSSEIHGS